MARPVSTAKLVDMYVKRKRADLRGAWRCVHLLSEPGVRLKCVWLNLSDVFAHLDAHCSFTGQPSTSRGDPEFLNQRERVDLLTAFLK